MADPIINPAAVHEKLAAVPKATHVASKVPAAAVGRMASPAASSDGGEEEGRGISGGGGGAGIGGEHAGPVRFTTCNTRWRRVISVSEHRSKETCLS